jgi:glucosamine-6-phosphate deaminase
MASATIADELTRKERIPTNIFDDPHEASVAVANEIAALIRSKQAQSKPCVLGLATGSTPTGVYNELVRLHREDGLSFANVVTFNLDEYFPMQPDELQSYHRFMREHLFDHLDIDPANIHIPDGTIAPAQVPAYCREYENAIAQAGGLDFQILGIGRSGHIGFNEPGSSESSLTRLITLDKVTRLDAASDFFGEKNVPRRAITMGVGTILHARRIVLMAFGEHKAPVIAQAIEGEVTSTIAASFLQGHANAQIVLDSAAADQLTRRKCPWTLGPVEWDPAVIRKAVIWLARELDKPILKLTEEDYNECGLQDLLADHGPAYNINIDIFRSIQATITGWPGGKPVEARRPGDQRRATDDIFPKRVLIFSPHPDDDVISMGGTLIRLADQGHEVHVAYQTSGNIAVFDEDAIRYIDFVAAFADAFELADDQAAPLERQMLDFLSNKEPGDVDSEPVQRVKALIRRGEARAAGRYCGLPNDRMHFMDMPFYETGRVRKKPISDEDVRITVGLLEQVKPHQIYVAGDLSDPHGTHRTCLTAVLRAIDGIKDQAWYEDCAVWLYRGAWQEWGIEQIDMAVPLSPSEVARKRDAIFKHQSQKDRALFPGTDTREFWQRAESRNHETARTYDRLGLAEYEAIEGFRRWDGRPM